MTENSIAALLHTHKNPIGWFFKLHRKTGLSHQ
jgi:hypothetical protein